MYKVFHLKESPILSKLFESYVPERPTRGVRIELEISKAKKGVFPPSALWVHNYGTLFPVREIRNLSSYSSLRGEVRRYLLNLDG